MAPGSHGAGAVPRPETGRIQRSRLRFGRRTLDPRRRSRRRGAGSRPQRGTVPALQLARRGGLRRSAPVPHAVSVRGTCREGTGPSAMMRSDALVLFGVTGDLAYQQIFPALYDMVRRDHLDVPILGVARSGWTVNRLRDRARESLENHGKVDEMVFAKLAGLLHYVEGDYEDPAAYGRLRGALGTAKHPLFH